MSKRGKNQRQTCLYTVRLLPSCKCDPSQPNRRNYIYWDPEIAVVIDSTRVITNWLHLWSIHGDSLLVYDHLIVVSGGHN